MQAALNKGGVDDGVKETKYVFDPETNTNPIINSRRQSAGQKILRGVGILFVLVLVFVAASIIVSCVICKAPFGLLAGDCYDTCVDLDLNSTHMNLKDEERLCDLHENICLLPKLSECGHPYTSKLINQRRKKRIAGGIEATQKCTFPWMVQVDGVAAGGQAVMCGGTLITKRYVLTSAHCVHCNNATDVYVSLQNEEYVRGVEEVTVHPQYVRSCPLKDDSDASMEIKDTYKSSDIAILRLSADVDSTISPVCLPYKKFYKLQDSEFMQKKYFAAGWGRVPNTSNIIPTENISYVSLPIVSHTPCQAFYFKDTTITPKMICAGLEGEGKDICDGDSGGPLFTDAQGRSFQVGVASFGKKPCNTGAPSVFIKLQTFLPWILDSMRP